jgi:hypothetical protein
MTDPLTGDEGSIADDLLAIDRDLADAERRIDTVAANRRAPTASRSATCSGT